MIQGIGVNPDRFPAPLTQHPTTKHCLLLGKKTPTGTTQTWRLVDLAREVDLPPAVVQKRMMLWVNQGVVSETSPGPVYRLIKDQVREKRGGRWIDSLPSGKPREVVVL